MKSTKTWSFSVRTFDAFDLGSKEMLTRYIGENLSLLSFLG